MFLALEIVVLYGATRLRLACNRFKLTDDLPPQVDSERLAGLSNAQTAAVAAYLSFAIVRLLGRLPTHPSCLIRSLVLLRLLARWGIDSTFVIGVRLKDGSLAAHAWVEYQGIPLLDPGGGEFARLLQREVTTDGHSSTVSNETVVCAK